MLLPFGIGGDLLVKMQDYELLREYVRSGSESAFAVLVARYVDLVFSTALRQVRDRTMAEDVSQTVFSLLARKAPSLRRVPTLAGWLYHTTRFKAAKAVRTEMRRRERERRTVEMNHDERAMDDLWQTLEPLLDEAVATLGEKDRLAILIRFFQRKPMRGVGDALGISEAAAKMRVARSLERLRQFFARRGVALSIAGLGTLLAERAVQAAPANLAPKLTSAALSTGSATGLLSLLPLLSRLTSFKLVPLILAGSAAALFIAAAAYNFRGLNHPGFTPTITARNNLPSEAVAAASSHSSISPVDPNLAFAIAQLRAVLHATNNILNVQPDEANRVFALFGNRLSEAFEVLKEEAGVHNPVRHSADPAEIPAGRAVSAMGILGKSVPDVRAWLWAQYESEPCKKSGWAFDVLNSLYAIGFQPQELPRLAEILARVDKPAEREDHDMSTSDMQADDHPGADPIAKDLEERAGTDESPTLAAKETGPTEFSSEEVTESEQLGEDGSPLLEPNGGEVDDSFLKMQVAGWIAEVIRNEPGATQPFISAVRDLLESSEAGTRFWGACALLPGAGEQNDRVVAEILAGLKEADTNRLIQASQLFQDFGDAARPLVLSLVEAAYASEGFAQRSAFRTVGKIAPELRVQFPEIDQVLAKDEADQRLLDKINARDYTGDDLVNMLNDPDNAVLGATLLGEMGSEATNALPALFESFSGTKPEDRDKIIEAIRNIDRQAALAPEDIASIFRSLADLVDKPEHKNIFRDGAGTSFGSLNWCTRAGFQKFATDLASRNPEIYSAFVGAVLAKAPAWKDVLQTRSSITTPDHDRVSESVN